MDDLYRTAIHESAYAVVAFHFGMEYEIVSVKEVGNGGHGYCTNRRWLKNGAPISEVNSWEELQVTLAGDATCVLFGLQPPTICSHDYGQANQLAAKEMSPNQMSQSLSAATQEAYGLILQYRSAVEGLAETLMQNGELRDYSAGSIIQGLYDGSVTS